MRYARLPWLGLLLVLGLAQAPAATQAREIWRMRYALPAGSRVTVINVQGSIQVDGWDRAEVELTVIKAAGSPGASLADVDIAVEWRSDSLRVRTLYSGESDQPVTVDYRLRVPRQVRLEGLRTVNGDIVVQNLEGSVEARTLNGHIEQAGIAGSVVARTLNGNVRVALRALPEGAGTVQLESVNGDINLLLPAAADAELELSTVAGRIASDLLFSAASAPDDTAVRARLGRGGVSVRLRTIRGNIRVAENQDVF